MAKDNMAKCPECGKRIEVDHDAEVGDVVFCSECDAELTVVKLNPLKLKAAEHSDLEDTDDLLSEEEEEDTDLPGHYGEEETGDDHGYDRENDY